MGTENAVMAATLTPGKTMISNAASEPHVQDLCRFLVLARREDRRHRLERAPRSPASNGSAAAQHCDRARSTSRSAASSAWPRVTGGDVTIEGIAPDDLWPILPVFRRLGIEVELGDDWVRVPPDQQLDDLDDLGGAIPKVEDGPWPQFPADLTSIAVVVATQAKGTVLVFEKMFESRLFFVDKLVSMGARIILCDPHRVVITGPTPLYGQRMSSPDIRAGMAMVIAALCAEGTLDDRRRVPDRQGLRTDRRTPTRARRADRACRGLGPRRHPIPSAPWRAHPAVRGSPSRQRAARTSKPGSRSSITWSASSRAPDASGRRSRSRPTAAGEAVAAAGAALGAAVRERLDTPGAAGPGWALVPADEALASAALERADESAARHERRLLRHPRRRRRPTTSRRGFSDELARAAGLNLHVRARSRATTRSTCSLRSSRRSALPSARRAGPCTQSTEEEAREQGSRSHRGGAGTVPGRAVLAGDQGRRASCSSRVRCRCSPGEKDLTGGRDRRRRPSRCFANLKAILEAAGSSLDKLVKTTVFLQNLDDFAGMNEVYARHVGDTPPARSTVEVAKLPSGALVEIEAIALV